MSLPARNTVPSGTPYGLPVLPDGLTPGERVLWVLRNECCLWSPGCPERVAFRGVRVLPCVQPAGGAGEVWPLEGDGKGDGGLSAQEAEDTVAVFAWCKPGDMRAARAYRSRLVMNVEAGSWRGMPDDPERVLDIWRETGPEGMRSVAVTSHGFILRKPSRAMEALANAGLVGIPQVYDADASAKPRSYVRTCVNMYRDAGFREVVLLLGTEAAIIRPGETTGIRTPAEGVDHMRRWADACEEMGCNFHIWAYGQVMEGSPELRRWVASLAGTRATPPVTAPSADDPDPEDSGQLPVPVPVPVPVAPSQRTYTGPLHVSVPGSGSGCNCTVDRGGSPGACPVHGAVS
jgi:hypothetical protein